MKQLNKSSNYNRAANLGKLACKGAIPWNRGIPRTEEVKEKLRIFRKNFYKNNPHPKGMLGKHHTKETIEKIRINSSTPEINKKKAAGTRKYVLSQLQTLEQALRTKDIWDKNNGTTFCIDCHKETDTYLKNIRKNI